jgi:hypothetical protein
MQHSGLLSPLSNTTGRKGATCIKYVASMLSDSLSFSILNILYIEYVIKHFLWTGDYVHFYLASCKLVIMKSAENQVMKV